MNERLITVTCPRCIVCGQQTHLRVPVEGHIKRMDGAAVQDAFPNMPTHMREMLITGTHPVCWDSMMLDLEDEEV